MAATLPPADVDVTPELVLGLLREQHSDLADRELRVLTAGWDNVLFRLGDDLLVRVPRRRVAAELIGNESRWLPVLAPDLPVTVPLPVRVGRPGNGLPWSWTVVPWIEGAPIGARPLASPAAVAERLGAFLAALHRPAPPDAPRSPVRGVPLAQRADRAARHLAEVARPDQRDGLERVWARALDAPPWSGPALWLHGDLHPLNLVERDGELVAVIDFGDITAGDPATDLLVAWTLFEPADRDRFRAAAANPHRPIDDAMWDRARGWALSIALAILEASPGHPDLGPILERTLDRVLADD